MRRIRKTEVVLLGLAALSFGIALSFYPHFPAKIPSLWDSEGNVVQTMPKSLIVLSTPFALVAFMLIIMTASRIRPSFEKKERFARHYDRFAILLFLWSFCVMLQLLLWPLGLQVSFFAVFAAGIGVLCYCFGVMFQKAQKNWFIALRSRWTLSDQEAWNRTHKVGGSLFKIAGITAVAGALLPVRYGGFLVAGPIPLVMAGLIAYAYIIGGVRYRNQTRG
ncbi:MAG: SdpI family protein [Planctomycetota bacterium]|jgi:uncharacterized membrane protein